MNLPSVLTNLWGSFQSRISLGRRRESASPTLPTAVTACESRQLLVAGGLDTTFADGTGQTSTRFDNGGYDTDLAQAVALQKDGKIVVVGSVEVADGARIWGIARYTTSGKLDTTFAGGIGKKTISPSRFPRVSDEVRGVAIQSDGKIVIVGHIENGNTSGYHDFVVVRLNKDGSTDTTFNVTGMQIISFGRNDRAYGVAIQKDGKIVVAGTTEDSTLTNMAVVRLNTNGTLDTTFDGDGKRTFTFNATGTGATSGTATYCRAIQIQPDGKIVLAGGYKGAGTADYDFAVARLKTDGSFDTSFDLDGKRTIGFDIGVSSSNDNDFANAIDFAGNKIVVAGRATYNGADMDIAVTRLNLNGSVDTTFSGDGKSTIAFNLGGNRWDEAKAVRVQADGKVVLSGMAKSTNTEHDYILVRMNKNGTLDTTFNGTGKVRSNLAGNDSSEALVIQSNGRIIGVGYATPFGDYDFGIARFLSK